jgi:hypothetical protein
MLTQICYASSASVPFDDAALLALLSEARTNNALQGITGILLSNAGHFVQVIEGEPAVVDALFEKISRDTRHQQVLVLYRQSVESRDFPHWSMAYKDLPDVTPDFLKDQSKARRLVMMFLAEMR